MTLLILTLGLAGWWLGPKLARWAIRHLGMIVARRQLYDYAARVHGLTRDQADLWWGATHYEGVYNPAGLWYRITRPRGGRHARKREPGDARRDGRQADEQRGGDARRPPYEAQP